MKTVVEANLWFDKLESEGALYVWGMNGEEITQSSVMKAYAAFKSNTYNLDYYMNKLNSGKGKIGADCSGAFAPLAGSDNTAAGYFSGCIEKGTINTVPSKACMVFKESTYGNIYHIGWYRPEDGTVSEMASSRLNFQRKALKDGNWDYWGIPRFIDYVEPVPEKKSGWIQEDGGWRFYNGDTGECVQNDWHLDPDGKWYWFDGSGMMVTNTWYRYNGSWYFLGSDGAMLKGQLLEHQDKWYYLDETGAMASKPITLTPDQDGALQFPGLVE